MPYEAKKFDQILKTPGFSEDSLKNHFTLYEGYVNNTNKLLGLLDTQEPGTVEHSELRRRLGWEWNGMRLHELYFGNITNDYKEPDSTSALCVKIASEFGSFELWEKAFKNIALGRGIGWAILYFDPESQRLLNVWVNEHDSGHFSGCVPILVLDIFEHAHYLDYGRDRGKYIEAFWQAIDWQTVTKRFSA